VASTEIFPPLLDLALVETSLAADAVYVLPDEETERQAVEQDPLKDGDVGILKAWHVGK
jgi:hypothetical protein